MAGHRPPPRGAGAAGGRSNRPPPRREKRSLAGLRGGPVARTGDARLAALCAAALDVHLTGEPLPLTHGFHSYPARFHPELARRLLGGLPAARRVLDPFAGSGTTLVEAAVAGRAGFGADLNPLAIRLARLKSTVTTPAQRESYLRGAAAIAEHAIAEGKAARRSGARPLAPTAATRFDDPALYPPHVYRELCTIRLAIDAAAPPAPTGEAGGWLRDALLLTLSSIVVKVSYQRSDTDARLVERHIGRGAPARLFAARAALLESQLAAFSAAVPAGTPPPELELADARHLRHLESASVDLVITSPPYAGTYDYAAHHERRFGWLGVSQRERDRLRKDELGPRRTGQAAPAAAAWRADVTSYLGEIARVLAPGGLAFLLVGDSRLGERDLAGDAEVRQAAAGADPGLTVEAVASQRRPLAFEAADGGRERREHLLALRRG